MIAQLKVERKPVLSSFGKAVSAARALSFCPSGGDNCARSCRHHPETTAREPGARCYAVRMEARRGGNIQRKLQRHGETSPNDLLAAAAHDLDRHGWRLATVAVCSWAMFIRRWKWLADGRASRCRETGSQDANGSHGSILHRMPCSRLWSESHPIRYGQVWQLYSLRGSPRRYRVPGPLAKSSNNQREPLPHGGGFSIAIVARYAIV